MSADKYAHVKASRKDIFINNFLGGIAWALGATIGISLLLAIAGFILSKLDTVPLVGDYISALNTYISEKSIR